MDGMKCFGWTVRQIAYAKKRHENMSGDKLEPNMSGILQLHKWWTESRWPEPLSVTLEGITIESDTVWAATAMRDAALNGLV